jgi:hypothetical protein
MIHSPLVIGADRTRRPDELSRIFDVANRFAQSLNKLADTFRECERPLLEIKSFWAFIFVHSDLFRNSGFGFRV